MQSKTVNCNLKVSIYIFLQQYFDLGKNNFFIGHMVKFSFLSNLAVLTGSPITSICAPLHGGASDCVHARHLKCVTEALLLKRTATYAPRCRHSAGRLLARVPGLPYTSCFTKANDECSRSLLHDSPSGIMSAMMIAQGLVTP